MRNGPHVHCGTGIENRVPESGRPLDRTVRIVPHWGRRCDVDRQFALGLFSLHARRSRRSNTPSLELLRQAGHRVDPRRRRPTSRSEHVQLGGRGTRTRRAPRGDRWRWPGSVLRRRPRRRQRRREIRGRLPGRERRQQSRHRRTSWSPLPCGVARDASLEDSRGAS